MEDMDVILLCCMVGAGLFGLVWIGVKLDKCIDLLQEVLRWL